MHTCAVIFAAFIVVTHVSSIRVARQDAAGWGAPPPPPTIEIELDGLAATSVDDAIVESSQDVSASAVGTVANPAVISLVAVAESDLEQANIVDQVAIGDILNLSGTSYNQVAGLNIGSATDNLLGSATGGQSAALSNLAAGLLTGSGVGAVGTNVSTSNVVNG